MLSDSDLNEIVKKIYPEKDLVLRDHQREAAKHLYEGRDVFVDVETGGGKTLIIQMTPLVSSHRIANPLVIVVVPLISLMNDLSAKINASGFKALCCDGSDAAAERSALANLDGYSFIVLSPEKALQKQYMDLWRRVSERICTICVDEAHLPKQWGQEIGPRQKTAFRPLYSNIHRIRDMVPDANILALTATAPPQTREKVVQILGMRQPSLVQMPYQRQNLFFRVAGISPKELIHNIPAFKELLEELKSKQDATPRTLVFCPSLAATTSLFDFFNFHLGELNWGGIRNSTSQPLVARFTSLTDSQSKAVILASLRESDQRVRLVVATSALALGVDTAGVRRVIFYGAPRNFADFIQQAGRAGRDEAAATVELLYFQQQTTSTKTKSKYFVEEDMRAFIVAKSCRRHVIAKFLNPESVPYPLELCCDICSGQAQPVESQPDSDAESEKRSTHSESTSSSSHMVSECDSQGEISEEEE